MSEEEKANEDGQQFAVPKKKVDSSWKEEVRKEKEKARATEDAKGKKAETSTGQDREAPTGEPSKVFLNFIAGLIQQALMQLGKMESPFTGGRDVDLEGARYTIELLSVLKEKTAGNLVGKEEQALTESIRELKFHFIETAKAVEDQARQQADSKQPGA